MQGRVKINSANPSNVMLTVIFLDFLSGVCRPTLPMAQFVEVTVSEQTFLGAEVEDKVLLILRREFRTLKDLFEKWELIYARLIKLQKLLQNLWEQRELSIKYCL